jgi:hypothetical protein
LAEFCSCGSLKINGSCTNKNCVNKVAAKPAAKSSAGRSTAPKALKAKPETSPSRTRRASKCITYNLYDLQKKEEESQ